ncbi:MAG: peptidoglycan DD-metalloendopeptidase family protein [Bacteroidales bacterium]|nr:peptidoglycan DD-metalloendopeptidase family protein [Bacteroidales bacterium]
MRIFGRNGIFAWLVVLALLSDFTLVVAQNVPQIHRDIHKKLMEEQDDGLAFRAMVDSLTTEQETEIFDLFPALDLYGSWDDEHVNPLIGKNVVIPAEKDIDISKFYPPTIGRVTSNYGWRRRRMHRGIDLKLYVGDTVRAAFDGQVRIRNFNRRGYGYYYVIRHSNGLETVYGHLSKFIVNQDEYVKAGQPIGLGGNTGRSTGSHLHFETRFMGIDLNPNHLIDWETFKPKMDVYHFEQKQALAESKNGGRRNRKGSSTTSSSSSSSSKNNASGNGIHRVKQGDTLGAIARRYGTSVNTLCKLNKIRPNSILRLGQKIRYR